ncbi:hypothetical protein [Novosphingobium rosa]|uniref:hypothetical protein n=1 Tax=Novosphingobium rosa TaxID=76978 RepID=UPI0012EDECF0|nr:hypothetical protein [Novosphingobium rosa]
MSRLVSPPVQRGFLRLNIQLFVWACLGSQCLALLTRWNPDFEKSSRQWILDQMEESGLEEEVALFRWDLSATGIV